MAEYPTLSIGDHAEKGAYGPSSSAAGTASGQTSHPRVNNGHMAPEDRHFQPFWLGRQRVYAEFSSPEDEGDNYEPGCICRRSPPIEVLLFDHATGHLEVSSGLEKVNSELSFHDITFLPLMKP